MQRASLIITEKNNSTEYSALIVDKNGIIGEALAKRLSEELLVVYVSKRLDKEVSSENIIFVPYNGRFPSIPENAYSYIFIIDDGGITRESLPKFVEKAEKNNSQLIFAVHIDYINEKPILKIINNLKKAKTVSDRTKIIIYGDIFSNEKIHDYKTAQSIVNKFISSSKRFGKIEVSGDGLNKTYPVFLDDTIDAILEVVFGAADLSSIFYLFPKHPPMQISLAHMMQKADPNIRIDFVKEKRKESSQVVFPQEGKYLLNDNYQLSDRIRKIFIGHEQNYFIDHDNQSLDVKKSNYRFLPLVGFLYLVFLLLLPLITTLSFSFLAVKILDGAKEEIDRGRLLNAQKLIKTAKTYFYLAKKTSAPLLIEARIIGRQGSLESIVKSIELGEDVSQAGLYFVESLNKASMVFMNKSKNPEEDFMQAQTMLKNSMVLFQKIHAEDRIPSRLISAIKEFDPLIKFSLGSIDILPNIFGFTGVKTYLILFQNNMELRPTGGFIGSFGLLTMNRGTVKDFSIHDVYDPDGQLKGHVEPPYPIRRFLPIEHWYLRDSNFDIDFVKSASKSAFFLNLETGKKADGVVGIDVSFVKNLLSAIGTIYLSDYKQSVNKNNLFELTQMYAEKDFFPGSKQKRDFLRSLFSSILLDIFQKKNLPYLSLAKVVSDSMLQKHLLFAFANPNIQDFFTVNNWSSSIWDRRLDTQNTVNDFIGINEANLGANKVNYLITRKVSEDIILDNKGKVFGELSILYDNTMSHSWLAGDYKNYLRIILQPGAELLSITINGIKQSIVKAIIDPKIYEAKKFVQPDGLEVYETEEADKKIYGFLVNVESKKNKNITIKYALAEKVDLTKPLFSYSLRFFKQPGTDEYPFNFSLSYPSFYNPVSIAKEFIKKEGLSADTQEKVSLSKTLNSDLDILINLARQ